MLLVDVRVDRVLVILKRCVFLNNGGDLDLAGWPTYVFFFSFSSFFFSH